MHESRDNDNLSEVVERRNQKLKILFSKIGDNFRVIGNPNNPTVIMDEDTILSVWAHNFFINFMDAPFKGKLLFSIKLTNHNTYYEEDYQKIISWLSNPSHHRPAYKIGMFCGNFEKNSGVPILYLTGYNYLNQEEKSGRYPVFANKCPKIYFTEEKAKEIMTELKKEGFDVFLDNSKIYEQFVKLP